MLVPGFRLFIRLSESNESLCSAQIESDFSSVVVSIQRLSFSTVDSNSVEGLTAKLREQKRAKMKRFFSIQTNKTVSTSLKTAKFYLLCYFLLIQLEWHHHRVAKNAFRFFQLTFYEFLCALPPALIKRECVVHRLHS